MANMAYFVTVNAKNVMHVIGSAYGEVFVKGLLFGWELQIQVITRPNTQ